MHCIYNAPSDCSIGKCAKIDVLAAIHGIDLAGHW